MTYLLETLYTMCLELCEHRETSDIGRWEVEIRPSEFVSLPRKNMAASRTVDTLSNPFHNCQNKILRRFAMPDSYLHVGGVIKNIFVRFRRLYTRIFTSSWNFPIQNFSSVCVVEVNCPDIISARTNIWRAILYRYDLQSPSRRGYDSSTPS